jgi:hypothetical protein
MSRVMSVLTVPGLMAKTVTPDPLTSVAIASVRRVSPVLATE